MPTSCITNKVFLIFESSKKLSAGNVGYAIINTKNVEQLRVGDTLTTAKNKASSPLPGYKDIKPMVFSGMYPVDSQDYQDLRTTNPSIQY